MSFFPQTSLTLLQKLAVEVTGGNEAAWVRFFALYTPAIRRFVEWNDKTHEPDDVIQDVYLKLVEILRTGTYQPDKARFRTFLATLIRRHLISLYRKDLARGGDRNFSLDELVEEPTVSPTQGDALDRQWAEAKHAAAVEHVLTKTAMSQRNKQVYRAHVLEGRSADEVAATFGITKNLVGQIKFRVEKAIAIIEEEFAD